MLKLVQKDKKKNGYCLKPVVSYSKRSKIVGLPTV